jgi:hypothetical protein
VATLALIATSFSLPTVAAAQTWGASGIVAGTSHYLLADVLTGFGLRARGPIGNRVVSIRLGFEHVSGTSHRFGVPCSGLIPPGSCPPEPLRDEGRLTSLAAGVALPLITARRFDLETLASLRVGRAHSRTLTRTSGEVLSAAKLLWGAEWGLDGTWAPWARVPVAVELSLSLGGLLPVMAEQVADGYTPFNQGFAMGRLALGVVWRRPR